VYDFGFRQHGVNLRLHLGGEDGSELLQALL
jgi:hypothetical protein